MLVKDVWTHLFLPYLYYFLHCTRHILTTSNRKLRYGEKCNEITLKLDSQICCCIYLK